MAYSDKSDFKNLENSIVKRFINGENAVFSELVELYKNRIHQFIVCIMGPDRESEDMAQEVFIEIYQSLKSFKGDSSFGTWAYAITRNICFHRLRSRKHSFISLDTRDEYDNPHSGIPDMSPSHEMIFEKEETKQIIRQAVESLPPIHRSVIFLSCWEGFSYKEISEILDIPEGTVKSRIHNAMESLAQKLKPVLSTERKV